MKIQKLSDEIIKKICAGEVILRPFNVLKEMLENSIDSGANRITITLSSNVLNVLNVTIEDNGCGIHQEDFTLLCERHCTSKITSKEDLTDISSYGFRGEALAAIAQVSKIIVKSKVKDSEFGYKGIYSNGILIEIEPVPLRDGTIIEVKDIFYNNKIRELKYFKKTNELNSMIDLVFCYAVNNSRINFSLLVGGKDKLFSSPDESNTCECCTYKPKSTNTFHKDLLYLKDHLDELQTFHSVNCCNQKVELIADYYKMRGRLEYFDSHYVTVIFSKPNCHLKTKTSIIFINGRLVENSFLKDYLIDIYENLLPKNRFPLIYLELRVPPTDIDVNVHPSKKEVLFNYEDILAEIIGKVIERRLKGHFIFEKENIEERLKRFKPSDIQQFNNETKIYSDPTQLSLSDLQMSNFKPTKTQLKLETIKQPNEVDDSFFKSLTYVGVYENKELYVQHSQYLLSCPLIPFLGNVFKGFFIENFGNLETVSVKIPLKIQQELSEFLITYFCMSFDGDHLLQIPAIFGQYNDCKEDWNQLSFVEIKEENPLETVLNFIVELYLKDFRLNNTVFNCIKRITRGIKDNLELFTIISDLKHLYKRFNR